MEYVLRKVSNFSKTLQELLDANGIRAAKLSKDLNISKSLISRYLRGEVSPKQDNLEAIAKYFNVTYAKLLGYDDSPTKQDIIKGKIDKMNEYQLETLEKFIDTFLLN